jgi:putative flippase GtrA
MDKKIELFQKTVLEKYPFLNKNKFTRNLISLLLTANFLRYLFIGFSTFFMQIFLLFVLFQLVGMEKQIANIFSSLLAMIFNYIFSNNWTFKAGSEKHAKKIGKYLILAVFNYTFDVVFAFPFLAVTMMINPYISKVFITAIIVCWNFFIYKFWVFKTK